MVSISLALMGKHTLKVWTDMAGINLEGRAKLVVEEERIKVVKTLGDILRGAAMEDMARQSAEEVKQIREEMGITQSLGAETRMVDVTDTEMGKLSSPEPLFKLSDEIRQPSFEKTELEEQPEPTQQPEEPQGNFESTLIDRLIKEEQFRDSAYRATKGEEFLTIGYGHYGADVKEGDKITQEEALALLRKDVNDRLPAIRKAIPSFDNFSNELKVEIAQSWFRGGMSGSPDTIKLINQGKFSQAATEFLDNEEYRTAKERGRAGIIPRMDAVAEALRKEGE